MDIQVMMPSPAVDFNFDSTSTSPFATAPSSPQRFGNFFYTAPTTPSPSSTVPFNWEQKPGLPFDHHHQQQQQQDDDDTDFAFDFSGQLEPPSISAADELFHGGKIKPLKPTPRLHLSTDSPRSPKSPKLRFKEALSPRNRKKDFDPFSEALKQTTRDQFQNPQHQPPRGRERTPTPTRHKPSRSLSPFRVADIFSDEENNPKTSTNQSSPFGLTWYNKWNLKNLLLFRSASEGSATTSKDQLKKYARIKKSRSDDVKNSSFRSTDTDTESGSSSKRMLRRKVSAHEIHYTANRAVAKEMSKKTSLPYKSGLLGCLGFHQITSTSGSIHEISRGISTGTRQRPGPGPGPGEEY